jgi:hypothetical protein
MYKPPSVDHAESRQRLMKVSETGVISQLTPLRGYQGLKVGLGERHAVEHVRTAAPATADTLGYFRAPPSC